MIIKTLSPKRGITALYDGNKYIIWSECYGIVAESTEIKRTRADGCFNDEEVQIDFDICEWFGYWDLQSIITRGIAKMENEFVPKAVIIRYHKVEGEQYSLKRHLKMETEKY